MQAGTHHWKMHLYIIHRLSPAIGSYVVHTDEFGAMKWVCKALCLGEKWGSRAYALINFKSTPIDATWSQKVSMLNRLCHVHMYLSLGKHRWLPELPKCRWSDQSEIPAGESTTSPSMCRAVISNFTPPYWRFIFSKKSVLANFKSILFIRSTYGANGEALTRLLLRWQGTHVCGRWQIMSKKGKKKGKKREGFPNLL